ncbi:hypothetical protein D3C84_673030 [compost metagenome]
MNGPVTQTQFLPGGDPSGKNLRQLPGAQLRQGIVGMDDDGDAIQTDDLLGGGAVQVTQCLERAQFTDLDRA